MGKKKKTKLFQLNYLITYLAIAYSGIPFFYDGNKLIRFILLLVFAGLFFYYRRKITNNVLYIIIIAIVIMFIQRIVFSAGDFFTFFSFIGITILTPYFAIKIVGPRFLKYFIDVMYVISLISLIFWLASNFVPGFHAFTFQVAGWLMPYTERIIQESLIVYNVESAQIYGLYRNPGPFHEPGGFAVFLTPAIIGQILQSGKLFSKPNMVMIINMLTTFSTAGYIALFLIFLFYFIVNKRFTVPTKAFSSILVIPFIIYLFINLEFLNNKIESQLSSQTTTSLNTATSGRFLGFRKSLVVLKNHHFYGRGLLAATKPLDITDEEAAGYGWPFWVSQLGIVFGALYLYFMYKTIRNYSLSNHQTKLFSYVAFFAILSVLFGQNHISLMVFFMIFLTSIEFPIKKYYRYYVINHNYE